MHYVLKYKKFISFLNVNLENKTKEFLAIAVKVN